MAESGVILPADSTGKALRTESQTTTFTTGSGGVVHQQVVAVGDPTTPANLLVVDASGRITVNQAAITKGTQGSTGVTTQDLKDSGRTPVTLFCSGTASVASDTLLSLTGWKAGAAVAAATSYTVTTGKTFRLQAVVFNARFTTASTTVTFANVKFSLRAITSGALAATSAPVLQQTLALAANMPSVSLETSVPDGLEFASGYVFGVSQLGSATTLSVDATLIGYEY